MKRFVGQNIKGTPAMSADKVLHDLRIVQAEADVAVLQEFRWPWYWRALKRLRGKGWASFPSYAQGLLRPVVSGQPVLWKRSLFKKLDVKVAPLHYGEAGISESRYIRAALLKDRKTGHPCWYGGTHFVVGGDAPGDGPIRKAILNEDLDVLEEFLGDLHATGHPVVFQLDANIHRDTKAFGELRRIVRDLSGRFVGELGVEYLLVIPGSRVEVRVHHDWTLPTSRLFTDHEGRGIAYTLTAR